MPAFLLQNVMMEEHLMGHVNIAIDGPAGAGKSTVAKEVARRLGILYVDTGAMYRSVAWLVIHYGTAEMGSDEIMALLKQHPLRFEPDSSGALEVYVDDRSITTELREPSVSEIVSKLSVYADLRVVLTQWQREFGERYSVVMDGRDIGTVVLPEANVKIFLTASLDERSRRRAMEFRDQGYATDVEAIRSAIAERDDRDQTRAVAPLRPAHDAHIIDSTGNTVLQIVEQILALVERVTHG
jgi:cytidylate kinase